MATSKLPFLGRCPLSASFCVALAMVSLLTPAAPAQSTIDRIRRTNGVDSGQITGMTALGVTISKGGVESTVPVEDIESIYLGGEPSELNSARNAVQSGRWTEANEQLAKIKLPADARQELVGEVDFYKALVAGQLAVTGQGSADSATTELRAFPSKHRTSFHIPQAIETLGDVLAAGGQYDAARTEYEKLALAKNPYYAMRSAWLSGRAFLAAGDSAQAVGQFEKALASTAVGPRADALRTSLALDRAVAKSGAGRTAESTKEIAAIIAKAKPEDVELLARAYNALGDCYLAGNDERGALYSFLHVDLLFNQQSAEHAKALHELSVLWKAQGRDDRSQQAAQELAKRYPTSRWLRETP